MSHDADNHVPEDVVSRLPDAAQKVYREAFNDAWTRYGRISRDRSRAEAVAWAAVKKQFHENEHGHWEAGASEGDIRHPKHLDERRIF